MVDVTDRTGDPLVAVADWSTLIAAALRDLGATRDGRVGLTWVSPDEIGDLAREHLGSDGAPTDVLSFPLDGVGEPDEIPNADADGRVMCDYGDIVVCPDVARRQSAEHAGTPTDEVAVLLVHSCCHLVGHDHAESEERERMWSAERQIVADHWGALAVDPWSRR